MLESWNHIMWSVQQIKGTVKQKGTAWETHKDCFRYEIAPYCKCLISGEKNHTDRATKWGNVLIREKNIYVHNCKVNMNPTRENATAPIKLFNYVHDNKRCFLCSKQRASYMICRASNFTARLPEAETLASLGCNKNMQKRSCLLCALRWQKHQCSAKESLRERVCVYCKGWMGEHCLF